jgi:hypothetical protein
VEGYKIIGEAVSRIPEKDDSIKLSNARKIVIPENVLFYTKKLVKVFGIQEFPTPEYY